MKEPTIKQRAFVKEYIANEGNASRAVQKAYNVTPTVAKAMGTQLLKKEQVKDLIAQSLAASGLSTDSIARQVKEGLEAKKLEWDNEAKCYRESVYPDHIVRDKAVGRLIDLLGVKAPEKRQLEVSGVLSLERVSEIRKRVLAAGSANNPIIVEESN